MTPTFSGRIQTRLFLLIFIGIPVTLLFGWIYAGFVWDRALIRALLTVLLTVNAIGFIFDPVYIWIQRPAGTGTGPSPTSSFFHGSSSGWHLWRSFWVWCHSCQIRAT
jgi:hypothetical protein